MKRLFICIVLLLPLHSFTQVITSNANVTGAGTLVFARNSLQAAQLAEKDILGKSPFLLLKGGIAPVSYATDSLFEKEYNVHYYELGCTGPSDSLVFSYNRVMFRYLTDVYGKQWTRKIRKDVVGFKTYKNNPR